MKSGSKEYVLRNLTLVTGNKFSDQDLKTAFHVITIARNLSAHADILYNTKFKCNISKTYPHIGEIEKIYNKNSKIRLNVKSSATAFIVIKAFFNNDEINDDLVQIKNRFDKMMRSQSSQAKKNILEQMGYDFKSLIDILISHN